MKVDRRPEVAAVDGAVVRHFEADPPPTRVVVAVSGGADSTALLLAVLRALGVSDRVVVAHFDHQLREESSKDAGSVVDLSRRLNIAVRSGAGDVRAFARAEHRSTEDAGRVLRYRFLHDVARTEDAGCVLVGHTADDQAEGVLLHITRGAGLRGLRGMAAVDRWPDGDTDGPAVHRPLLGLRRATTRAYCEALGVRFRDDPSNADRRYARNRVRLDVNPALEKINPRFVQAVSELAGDARAWSAYLDVLVASAGAAIVEQRGGGVRLRREIAAALPGPVLARVAADALGAAGVSEPGRRGVEALIDLVRGTGGRRGSFGGGVSAEAEGGWLVLGPTADGEPAPGGVALPVPGEVEFGAWRLRVVTREPVDGKGGEVVRLMVDTGECLRVRARRPGDRVRLDSSGRTRKLQDLMSEARVPRGARGGWPVVCREDGTITWVPGVARASGAGAGEGEAWVEARRIGRD